jgi:putative ABC transport system permease protein
VLRASLRELLAYRGRLVATVLAIVLGVGFVAGTLVFNDAMRADFYDRFAQAERGVDVAVAPRPPRTSVDPAQVTAVRGVRGVAVAEPRLSGDVGILDDGDRAAGDRAAGDGAAGARNGAIGISVATDPRLRWQEPTSGRLPGAAGEVALDDATVQRRRLRTGDTVRVGVDGRIGSFTLVGTVDPGLGRDFAGSGVVALPTADLRRLFAARGYDRIDAVAADGTSPGEVARRVAAAVGTGFTVSTGDELRDRAATEVATELGGFSTLLLLFAVVALLVAAFVIANTFTILVAQRSRQLALLRCLGAARAQLLRAVLAEAAVLGSVASVIGIGAGFGVAVGLRALLRALTLVGTATFSLSPSTVAIGLASGVAVTLGAAVIPAIRATRVAPLAAMRAQALAPASRPGRVAGVAGALLLASGGTLLWLAGTRDLAAALLAGGALTFGGLVVFAPHLVGPAGRLLGAATGAARRVPGRLAVANATRNPRRTAATTAALMIGVTLLTAFATGASSLKASATAAIGKEFPVEFAVSAGGGRVPAAVVERLRGSTAFDVVTVQRAADVDLGGRRTNVIGVDRGYVDALDRGVFTERAVAGSLHDLTTGTAAISARFAADDRLGVGGTVELPAGGGGEGGGPARLRIVTVYGEPDGPRSLTLTLADHRTAVASGRENVLVSAADGVSSAAARDVVLDAVAAYPGLLVGDQATYVEELTREVNSLLGLVGGLLALALAIALLGIANTLGLSVVERVRESALLRALGLTRAQLRAMLAVEAVVTALLGALLGLGLGLLFARAAVATISGDAGFEVFAIPWAQLAAGIAGAVVVGLAASVLPGRAAARTDVVHALAAD